MSFGALLANESLDVKARVDGRRPFGSADKDKLATTAMRGTRLIVH
jgi:hypothetical protein